MVSVYIIWKQNVVYVGVWVGVWVGGCAVCFCLRNMSAGKQILLVIDSLFYYSVPSK